MGYKPSTMIKKRAILLQGYTLGIIKINIQKVCANRIIFGDTANIQAKDKKKRGGD